ncbi:protein-ADP-ribose hydrolase [Streptomyces sp. NPDC093252]|uniref:protein-ADP-ribose hydrolase n=1 Tax=Streptomyces sp. NPDC093252 TaxID=3154980 RepID=UPI00342185D3
MPTPTPTPTPPPAPTPAPTSALKLADYRAAIALDDPFRTTTDPTDPADPTDPTDPAVPARPAHLVRAALSAMSEDPATAGSVPGAGDTDRLDDPAARRLLRAVLTLRGPGPLPPPVSRVLDALLSGERAARTVTDPDRLPLVAEEFPGTAYPAAERTVLWQGDITALGADAIVNAANSAMLGCFVPLHPCIDNAIHSAAGPRLREDCHTVMVRQGHPEATGTAKITRGYHLPARYVLHTVGPVVDGPLHATHARLLAASYRACLDLAAEVGTIRTVAFCGISTGVFGYPRRPAARIALDTVADWLARHPGRLDRVIFNVFTSDDRAAYLGALTEEATTR